MSSGIFRSIRHALGILLFSLLLDPAAQASVVVDGTRVVYPSNKREVTVNLHNNGDKPSLVQVWIDDGNTKSRPGEAKVPFVLTPPLFRVDPAKGQTLRIVYTQEPLATDRETLFWLNVLDIPPRAPLNPDAPNQLELAFRHRLKLFFRPAELHGDPADAPHKITWTLANKDGQPVVTATNPTGYHVSFTQLELSAGTASMTGAAGMVAPFAAQRFALAGARHLSGPVTVKFTFVNDYGGLATGEAPVSVAP